MIESRIIVKDATEKTGSVVISELVNADYPVRTMVRQEDGRSAQLKKKGSVMKLFKIAALFLLSISTHAALAGEIKPYSQAEFNKLAAEGKPILLDFRADWCATCAAQAPVIRELMAQGKYKDLTTFTIDFDTETALLKAYNVRLQSTLIVFTGKQEEDRSVGDTKREAIELLLNKVVH
jgi:thiol:disulfide interchange protein